MINKYSAKKYCKEDISLIENYDKAIADTTKMWECHHRNEIKVLPSGMTVICTKQELKENDHYYNCPANELIFLTQSEHRKLHNIHRTVETRRKISEAHKGKSSWNKGKSSWNKGKATSIFGKSFKEHYGITSCDDIKLYRKEYNFYKKYNKFSWE